MDAVMSVSSIAGFDLTAESSSQTRLVRPLVRLAVCICTGVLFFAAAFLWFRRAVGAISTPLSASALVGVGLAVAATALAARHIWRRTAATRSTTITFSGLLTVSALAFAAATSLPGSAPLGLVGLWRVVLGGDLWNGWPRQPALATRAGAISYPPQPLAPVPQGRQPFERAVADSMLGLTVTQEHVTQQVTRLLEPDGTERVMGWMRVSFEPGQRLASVHLAFCPPFARTPEATLERLEGPQVRIKRVQTFPFGARFDLKLDTPAERRSDVLLHVAAETHGEPNVASRAEAVPSHDTTPHNG